MSGHSHWAGIKHKKAKEDARRGKVFSRIARQIMTAVREGGKDPDTNLDLAYAMEAARAANMPKDNIERAILKGAGELPGKALESARYEGYGVAGVAIVVEALTDNRNRTTANIRRIFSDHGNELGTSGCVAWTFDMKGVILIELGERPEEEVFDLAIEAGAEDFQQSGDYYEIIAEPKDFRAVREAITEAGVQVESAEMSLIPKTWVDLGAADARRMLRMMAALEDAEDVTNVAANFNVPDELLAEMQQA